jgi:hypothetical protein
MILYPKPVEGRTIDLQRFFFFVGDPFTNSQNEVPGLPSKCDRPALEGELDESPSMHRVAITIAFVER